MQSSSPEPSECDSELSTSISSFSAPEQIGPVRTSPSNLEADNSTRVSEGSRLYVCSDQSVGLRVVFRDASSSCNMSGKDVETEKDSTPYKLAVEDLDTFSKNTSERHIGAMSEPTRSRKPGLRRVNKSTSKTVVQTLKSLSSKQTSRSMTWFNFNKLYAEVRRLDPATSLSEKEFSQAVMDCVKAEVVQIQSGCYRLAPKSSLRESGNGSEFDSNTDTCSEDSRNLPMKKSHQRGGRDDQPSPPVMPKRKRRDGAKSTSKSRKLSNSSQSSSSIVQSGDSLSLNCFICNWGSTAGWLMLRCCDCGTSAHTQCLKYSNRLGLKAREVGWQCNDCKTCTLCDSGDNQDSLLLCDSCDRAFHLTCNDPPLVSAPKGEWVCSFCTYVIKDKGSRLRETKPSESKGSFLSSEFCKPVTEWSTDEVFTHLSQDVSLNIAAKQLQSLNMTGQKLMTLTRSDCQKSFGLKLGCALKLYKRLFMLQAGHVSRAPLYA